MFRIEASRSNRSQRYCDGMTRRNFVQLGVAGMASAGLPTILQAKEASSQSGSPAKDTAVILLWLDGGPSHLDLYDMKPEAPSEYRGIWSPIKTNVPGIEISELLPHQAKVADKFAILRSLHHDNGDHFTGAHYMLTSRGGANGGDTTGKSPSIGSIAARVLGPRKPGLPPYVAVPYASSIGIRPGYFGANYLGSTYDPFETEGDPNAKDFRVQNLNLNGGMTIERLNERRALRKYFDELHRTVDASGMAQSMDRFQEQAFELVAGAAARKAFDIGGEDEKLRETYGRNNFGQSCLLARRLVEAGTTFVTVHSGGWDDHWNLKAGYEGKVPPVDQAVAALLTDLSDRGQLEKTLVMLCGEFSRTPRMNDGGNGGAAGSMGTPGRDHWGNATFCLLAGGGVKGGRVVGATNSRGEAPIERPVTVGDLHATIYHVLGIDPATHFLNHAGRPVAAIDSGEVIQELF
ncbi:MAG: DUF1501 domain-containing protein [Pirellulales bacterium]